MPKLIIINGAPGIGKTTVAELVFSKLKNSAFLDGDSVWRINPFQVNERMKALADKNIALILRNYLEAGYQYVILSWVLHEREIIDRLLRDLSDLDFEAQVFTLIAEEGALLERVRSRDPSRKNLQLVRERLRQSLALETRKIDVTKLGPEEVAAEILAAVSCRLRRL